MSPKNYSVNLKDEDSEIFTKFAKLIQNRLKRYSEVDFTNPAPRNSPVFGDDKYLAGFPISLYVAHQATVAMENIASLWDLIAHERDGKVHLSVRGQGAFSIIRSSIEASAQAYWVLIPTLRWDRIKRRLALRVDENKHEASALSVWAHGASRNRSYSEYMPDTALSDNEVQETLNADLEKIDAKRARSYELAAATGHITEEDLNKASKQCGWIAVLGDIESYSNEFSSLRLQAIWRTCAGLSHGKQWAQLAYLDYDQIPESSQNGVSTYAISPSIPRLAEYGLAAIKLIDALLELHQFRTTPYNRHPPVLG